MIYKQKFANNFYECPQSIFIPKFYIATKSKTKLKLSQGRHFVYIRTEHLTNNVYFLKVPKAIRLAKHTVWTQF